MKKIIAFLLAFLLITALVACKNNEEKPLETTEVHEEKVFAVIEAKDCFYNAGFTLLIAGATETCEYTFTAENSEDIVWSVYMFDEEFDDGLRYIKQATDPILVGDGSVVINAGQFVYLYCSSNEFTTDAINESAKLNITTK